jgi:hypothetical protein
MKQLLLALGLLVASFLGACKSGPETSGQPAECKVCAANKAVKAAIPEAPAQPCAACVQHEMLQACPKCAEMGKPCSEACAAKVTCPICTKESGACAACALAQASCATCAVKGATWNQMACPTCKDAAQPCPKCVELKAKLATVTCADCAKKS